MKWADVETGITQEYVKARLDYNPLTGVFTWKSFNYTGKRCGGFNKKYAGKQAGLLSEQGYIRITLDGYTYMASRLAWIYIYGLPADKEVDHKNRVRSDNRLANLRLADDGQNARNRKLASHNTSGYKGVSWNIQHRKWMASICKNGVSKTLGVFREKSDAIAAYDKAARQLHEQYAALNSEL